MKKQTEREATELNCNNSFDMASASRYVFSSVLANPQPDMANSRVGKSLAFCSEFVKQILGLVRRLKCGFSVEVEAFAISSEKLAAVIFVGLFFTRRKRISQGQTNCIAANFMLCTSPLPSVACDKGKCNLSGFSLVMAQ